MTDFHTIGALMEFIVLAAVLAAVSFVLIAVVWHIQDLRDRVQVHEDLLFKLTFPDLTRRHPALRNRKEEL